LDGKAKLVRLPSADPAKNVIARELTVALSKNGSARIDLAYEVTGHAAPSFRSNFEAESTRRDRVAQNMGAEFPGVDIDKNGISMNDLSDIETPVTIDIQGKAPLFARQEGDALSMPVTLNVRLTSS